MLTVYVTVESFLVIINSLSLSLRLTSQHHIITIVAVNVVSWIFVSLSLPSSNALDVVFKAENQFLTFIDIFNPEEQRRGLHQEYIKKLQHLKPIAMIVIKLRYNLSARQKNDGIHQQKVSNPIRLHALHHRLRAPKEKRCQRSVVLNKTRDYLSIMCFYLKKRELNSVVCTIVKELR